MEDTTPIHILVVDDAAELRSLLRIMLEDAGYQVSTAEDGVTALESVEASPPDLILLDVEMPRMNGFETCLRLQGDAASQSIPVLFLTSETESNRIAQGFELGAVDYVTKPFSEVELLARVKTQVRLTQLVQRLDRVAQNMSKYLPAQICDAIFAGESDVRIESQQRPLTICFTDIAGFTQMVATREPGELTEWLNHYFTEMAFIVTSHGGTLDKYIGDAMMVFFGAPDTRGEKEDAVACVEMAQAMVSRSREMGIPIRVGISSGECTVGNFGSELQMGYTIIGREVNVASRLQAEGSPDQILISESTYELIKDDLACTANTEVNVRGLEHSVMTYWLNN